MIVLASKASGCVFSKNKIKNSKTCIMTSFDWFGEWSLIHHISLSIKVLAWKQLEFMKLCAKERKIIYGIVYRKIKNYTIKKVVGENMYKKYA